MGGKNPDCAFVAFLEPDDMRLGRVEVTCSPCAFLGFSTVKRQLSVLQVLTVQMQVILCTSVIM